MIKLDPSVRSLDWFLFCELKASSQFVKMVSKATSCVRTSVLPALAMERETAFDGGVADNVHGYDFPPHCTCVCLFLVFQSFLGFGSSAEVTIDLAEFEKRKKVDVKNEDGKKEKLPLYLDGESVTGKVACHSHWTLHA